ncbi:hypothetical protein HWB51_gp034 [Mycobacterium phage Cuke]|uniref:Uncharacterized protein n=1 Tax=Mycobacterium phage Cuke TaxID=2079417 RepID=A0A2L1IWX0_9CAUD|nr:hypothetical protein HWB51_gp034 [Mycobacterium phage Cuke]AVD99652.1 hypothetical protein SEA_CUKE_34 [Mycobacterium phage Cuke]
MTQPLSNCTIEAPKLSIGYLKGATEVAPRMDGKRCATEGLERIAPFHRA